LNDFPEIRRRRSLAVLVAAAFVILFCLFAQLGALGLVGPDEPRYAWIARAMVETRDWVTPRLYGQPWFEKPVLYYWAAAIGFLMHLPAEWAARLPSAFAALAVALALGWLGWKHYGGARNLERSPALLAPLMFSTSVAAVGFARAATPDMLFAASLTLAMACASGILRRSGILRGPAGSTASEETRSTVRYVLFGASLGLAVLAKGPAALILAGGTIGLWALATSQWRAGFRFAHPAAIGAFCIVALPWYVLCAVRNPEFLHVFIFQHNFERYLTPVFQHKQPFWFFGPITLLALVPWVPLLIAAAQEGLRLWREKSWTNSPGFFFACWAIFPIVFFSFSQSKLPGYVLPAIPPLALLLGVSAPRAFEKSRALAIALSAGIGFVWVALAVCFLYSARSIPMTDMGRFVPLPLGEALIALSVLLTFALVIAGVGRKPSVVAAICSLSVVVTLAAANIAVLPILDLLVSARPQGALLRNDLRPDRVFTYELPRASQYGLAFYLHREIPEWSPQDPEAALVLTTSNGFNEIVKSSRFSGDLDQNYQIILLVPVEARPR
jgi:4-amino-4-deoxy-L-arabinose transferase-like glycosyltransferase